MTVDLASVALMGAVQTMVMALVLWLSTGSYAGVARSSIRIRAVAQALEAMGWLLLGLRGQVGDWLSIPVANAVMLLSFALTVRALRMLLGVRNRQREVMIASVIGWLAIVWFVEVTPDFRARVLCASAVILFDLSLLLMPLSEGLRRGGSAAKRILLAALAVAVLMVLWRVAEPMFSSNPTHALLAPTLANVVYIMFSAMQPLFTSVGFLLLYNETMQKDLKSLARIDPLTGVGNRLALEEAIIRLLEGAARDGRPLGVLMLDADHFKSVNDRFGHSGGDKVLRRLVASIQPMLEGNQMLGRIGGEEFVVLSPGRTLQEMSALGERIRAAVEGTPMLLDREALTMTVSVGVTTALPGETDMAALLHRVDAALYAAKRAGRNGVVAVAAE